MAIILSNAKATGPKSLCGTYSTPRKQGISNEIEKELFIYTLATAVVPFPFTFLPPPPTLLILFFLFFSSNPLPNILISDLAGLVDAKKEATNMNLDILGSVFVPDVVTSDEGGGCWE